jgi:hypothetical protein
MGEE